MIPHQIHLDFWKSLLCHHCIILFTKSNIPHSVSSGLRIPSSASPRPCSRTRWTAALVSSSLLHMSRRTLPRVPGSQRKNPRLCKAAGLDEATAKAGRGKRLRSQGYLHVLCSWCSDYSSMIMTNWTFKLRVLFYGGTKKSDAVFVCAREEDEKNVFEYLKMALQMALVLPLSCLCQPS